MKAASYLQASHRGDEPARHFIVDLFSTVCPRRKTKGRSFCDICDQTWHKVDPDLKGAY